MTGLVIRDTTGKITLDMTYKLSQTDGFVTTNSVNGSATIPSPPTGKTAFYAVTTLVDLQREKGKLPGVTLSGNTLSWAYSYNTQNWGYFSANCRIYYGYY